MRSLAFIMALMFCTVGTALAEEIHVLIEHPTPEIVDGYTLFISYVKDAFSDTGIDVKKDEGGFGHYSIVLDPKWPVKFYFAAKAYNEYGSSDMSPVVEHIVNKELPPAPPALKVNVIVGIGD